MDIGAEQNARHLGVLDIGVDQALNPLHTHILGRMRSAEVMIVFVEVNRSFLFLNDSAIHDFALPYLFWFFREFCG